VTFSRIYRENEWNGVETRSGPGSGSAATTRLRQVLLELVAELGITSVVDAACGEGFWQPDLPGYVGLDVAPEAIEVARATHPEREYRVQDVAQGCPRADLVICRDALQHLSLRDAQAVLAAIRASGSTYLLASTYVCGENVRIATGGFYSPNLEAPPFAMPPAARRYHDGYDYSEGTSLRDPSKMLGLWRL
jgi:SAM-dependent methyltransferase